jgi:hypothetical protein
MTWAETSNTQAKGKKTTRKQSSCFRLTSIELLGAVSKTHAFLLKFATSISQVRRLSVLPLAH